MKKLQGSRRSDPSVLHAREAARTCVRSSALSTATAVAGERGPARNISAGAAADAPPHDRISRAELVLATRCSRAGAPQGGAVPARHVRLGIGRLAIGPFVYVRFHGTQKYTGSYSDCALDEWAEWLADRHREGRPIYAYFNNDTGGHAAARRRAPARRSRLARRPGGPGRPGGSGGSEGWLVAARRTWSLRPT
jgi:hypothetical protein